jgi:uncharacterized membrane protein
VFDAAWTDFTVASAIPANSSPGVADAEGAPETEPVRIAAPAKTTPRRRRCFSPDCIALVSTQYLDIYTWEALLAREKTEAIVSGGMSMPAEGTLRMIATFAAAFGIGVAGYIAIEAAGGDAPACIAGSSGCETVANSTYSHLFGVNIAVFGIVGYVLLLAASLLRGDGARMTGFGIALVGFGYSVYLTYLELFKIEAICQWCVCSAVLMTILFGLSAMRMVGYVGKPA